MPSYGTSNFHYLGAWEDSAGSDTPGGLVLRFLAGAALNIGDLVYVSAAHTVNKSGTKALYKSFAGVVVGGKKTHGQVIQDDNAVGTQAAATGEEVLVGVAGCFKVVNGAAQIAAGVPFGASAATAGACLAPVAGDYVLGIMLETIAATGKALALVRGVLYIEPA